MYSVTKQRRVEDGLCSRRDWTARLISTATGTTTNVAKIHRLTSDDKNVLRVDLEDFEGNTTYAEYNLFSVMSEKDKYRLIVGFYSGRTVISSLLF